jgi:tetratricopeptide (TPR) repeat protein
VKALGVPRPERLPPNARACPENLWAAVLRATGICAVILAAGCAGTVRSSGVRLLEQGRFAAAEETLRAESALRPDDPLVQRDLGVAILESGRAAEAAGILRKVRIALPRDAGTAFQLGRACEGSGDLDGALDAYRDYLALGGRGKDEIAARLQAVTRRRIEAEMRTVLANEDSLATVEVPENAVAVPDFANPARSDSLAPLARGLAALLITDLSRVDVLRVVERSRLQVLLDELDLTRPTSQEAARTVPAFTAALAPRVGHLLGARRFVQGSFLPLPDAQVQLDASIMDIGGGLLVGTGEPIQGRLSEILRLEKTLGVLILEALGVPVDAATRRALGEPATDDFQAFISFSRGLVLEDQGRIEEAAADYRLAVERSPSFTEAAERLRIASVGAAEQKGLDRSEVRNLTRPTSLSTGAVERQVGALGLGPLPDGDEGSPESPRPNDGAPPDPGVRMVIEGDIPGGNP